MNNSLCLHKIIYKKEQNNGLQVYNLLWRKRYNIVNLILFTNKNKHKVCENICSVLYAMKTSDKCLNNFHIFHFFIQISFHNS